MKRIQTAVIFQTILFSQKPEMGYAPDQALKIDRQELQRYRDHLERTRTRYQITDEQEREDGSILIRVRKQYNEKIDVGEYFQS